MSVVVFWLSDVSKVQGRCPWGCVLACVHGKGTMCIERKYEMILIIVK